MLKIIRYIIMLLKDQKTYKWAAIGILALICDYLLYNFLLDKIGMDMAKAASTFLGVNISFHFNRLWTFKSESAYFDDLKRYLALYVVAILVNVVVNNFAFKVVQDIDLAYFIALFVSVIIGYFGQRLWVFKNRVK